MKKLKQLKSEMVSRNYKKKLNKQLDQKMHKATMFQNIGLLKKKERSMRTKKAIFALSLCISISIFSCQVILKNTSKKRVLVRDLKARTPYVPVGKNGVTANENHNDLALLEVVIGSTPYTVRQKACSGEHLIILSSKKIAHKKAGKLFEVEKEKQ